MAVFNGLNKAQASDCITTTIIQNKQQQSNNSKGACAPVQLIFTIEKSNSNCNVNKNCRNEVIGPVKSTPVNGKTKETPAVQLRTHKHVKYVGRCMRKY